jgi:hypothetical protein
MESLKSKVYQERGMTFSPRINDKSKDLQRGVDNLILWNEVKKIKQVEKQKVSDEISRQKKSFVNPLSREMLKYKSESC